MPARPARTTLITGLVLGAALIVGACGGGSASSTDAAPADQTAAASDPAATAIVGDAGATESELAAAVQVDHVKAALGEQPEPECDTSVLSGSRSCVWMAADGSWLKVEDGEAQEMPDLGSFTTRVTKTLGLEEAVDGLGEAAYLDASSRGTRIAVFVGDGRTLWVAISRPGDVAAQASIVKEIAGTLLADS